MRDAITSNHLHEMGFDFKDMKVLSEIDRIEALPRVLDKPIKVMNLKRSNETPVCSIGSYMTAYYNDNYGTDNVSEHFISLPQGNRPISKSTCCVLKSLLYLSTGKDTLLCKAAAELFVAIATTGSGPVTDELLYEVVSRKTNDYYTRALCESVLASVYSNTEVIMHWRQIAECGGWYENAIEAGEKYINEMKIMDIKTLDKLLAAAYKAVKANKKWMSLLMKNVPTKPLIGMLWILYPNNPSVLEPSKASDAGFLNPDKSLQICCALSLDDLVDNHIYAILQSDRNVSVNTVLAERVKQLVIRLYMKENRCTEEEAVMRFNGDRGIIIPTDEEDVGAEHVKKIGNMYVCA